MWGKGWALPSIQGCSSLVNQYHNRLFQKKKKNRGKGRLRTYVFEKAPGIFRFLFYPWKFQTKQGITPRNSTKLCYTPQKFQGLKPTRPMEIQHGF